MTFASETTRFLFHQLPTEVQVQYTDMEHRLAKYQQALCIDGVMTYDHTSEVLIRISYDSKANAIPSYGTASTKSF